MVFLKRASSHVGAFILTLALLLSHATWAQTGDQAVSFKKEELDQILAPIALYPDDLLSNVLVAATYPLEIVQAARWRKEPANAKLKGDALAKALEAKDWDPSVKSLVPFPDVLQTMSDKLEWTQKLGDAFLAQPDDVMDQIQFLRQKAETTGALKSNEQQKVTTKQEKIIIEPVKTDVVYVPVYEPTVVYGPWWYPAYPPYYWYWGRPASAFVSGIYWGAGFAVANSLWGWGRCNWWDHNIDIDINRYNNINVNRTQITSNKWQHDPKHRGAVPYRDQVSREKFGKADKLKDARKDFRGFENGELGDRARDKLGPEGADKVKDRHGEGGGQKNKDKDKAGSLDADRVKDRLGEGGGQKIKDKAGKLDAGTIKDKAGSGKIANKPATRDISPPKSKPATKALDIKPSRDVEKQIDRGSASRKSAGAQRSVSRPSGGGSGANRAGGGGGRR